MTALVLDAGALIALDRNDREVWAMLRVAADDSSIVQVPAGAIGQAWRDGAGQALLARALRHCDEVALEATAGSRCSTCRTWVGRRGSSTRAIWGGLDRRYQRGDAFGTGDELWTLSACLNEQ